MVPEEAARVAEEAVRVLSKQAHTLHQEFAMEVSGGRLCSLPDIMGGILPRPRGLPQLLLTLARAFTDDGRLDAHLACQVGRSGEHTLLESATWHRFDLASQGVTAKNRCCMQALAKFSAVAADSTESNCQVILPDSAVLERL